MDEKQVMSQASSLVLQTEHEKFLSKLQNMRLSYLTAEQQEELRERKYSFIKLFRKLSRSFFGLSKEQIREFNNSELMVLDELISRKARLWAICQILFTFGVPLVGQLIGFIRFMEGGFESCLYLYHRKYLKKSCGKDYFPFEELKQKL